jgi:hypothetical protein
MKQQNTICAKRGNTCHSKTNCKRFTAPRDTESMEAALYVRRGAGDSACDMYQPINVVTTFKVEA